MSSSFYRSELNFMQLRERAFRTTWNFGGVIDKDSDYNVLPFDLLPGFLNEPLLLSHDGASTQCLTNVCTHRGNLLIEEPGKSRILRCRYHGRCFGLDGQFRSMPGFEDVEEFPSEKDNLVRLNHESIGPMHFVRLSGAKTWEEQFGQMLRRMHWVDLDNLTYRPDASKDYEVNAHWALYVDNYLEGFHVPFVHPSLNDSLEIEEYKVELTDGGVLQIGYADKDESDVHDIPADSEFAGQHIYAFYWWLYPNIMVNYYPWGISLNVVEPINLNKTKVRFLTFAYRELDDPDVSGIHQTELEDEAIVESVQRGMRSSFYDRGRYSPKHEKAVHHFHRMISRDIYE